MNSVDLCFAMYSVLKQFELHSTWFGRTKILIGFLVGQLTINFVPANLIDKLLCLHCIVKGASKKSFATCRLYTNNLKKMKNIPIRLGQYAIIIDRSTHSFHVQINKKIHFR